MTKGYRKNVSFSVVILGQTTPNITKSKVVSMAKSEVGEFVYVRCAKPSINSRYLSLGIKQFTVY